MSSLKNDDALVGKDLPNITLAVTAKQQITLPDDFKNKWTILYFYPKDDTPGCTKQACSYQENMNRFQDIGVDVYGVSMDDISSHEAFQNKFQFRFPLIADTKKVLSEALSVYGDQEWQGKVYQGLSRDSFLINPEGKIELVWRNVNPLTTVDETLTAAMEYV